MSSGPEYEISEQPFIDQLLAMNSQGLSEAEWKYTTGNIDDPSATDRDSFREVLLKTDLRDALRRINLDDDGEPWLDEDRISQAVGTLDRIAAPNLLEANQASTHLLMEGTTVDGVDGWDQGRAQTVHYIDWDHPDRNTFRVVNQLRVDEPGGQAKKFVLPDLVLFVNGIPLVVVECKDPAASHPIRVAIDQIQRYSNQRDWVDGNEGNERLFWYSQFVVATSFDEARVATFTAQAIHYLEWKDTSPLPMAQVTEAMGKKRLSSQEALVAGMLRPENLLDIVRHHTLFKTEGGRTFKIVCRYQQYRAVQQAVERLSTGKTRTEDGEHDRRGGIVWHTQGSGKSLTMVFLIRKMRSTPELKGFKVVVVTDRKDLEKQLAETAELTGEPLTRVKPKTMGGVTKSGAEVLKETLALPGRDLVFAMIQKYRGDIEEEDGGAGDEVIPAKVDPFPVLNEDEKILVMVDEAHRSHGSDLHANLLKALPNCARIGFTGTPTIMGAKKRTHEIFGEFLDVYTIKQAEEDEAIVPILYEGRTAHGAVEGGGELDEKFPDMFPEYSADELERIKAKYATKGDVLEAPALIEEKARDMLLHYVSNILPNGFKAQVVAVSRRATIRYHSAFEKARAALVEDLRRLPEELLRLSDEDIDALPEAQRTLVRAHPYLRTLNVLEFAPVISSSNNQDGAWNEWTDRSKIDVRIERFKKPLPVSDEHFDVPKQAERYDSLAFLIVKSMLLTGFDAPVEQVMYLDRGMREAELLQAVARVNRRCGEKKSAGIVVDYYGIARHLKDALAAYTEDEVEGALTSLKDEIPKLRDRHRRVLDVFLSRGVEDITKDAEECVWILREEQVRAEFQVKLKHFLSTLDLVLPRPEGLPYVHDAKVLAATQARARNRYRKGERPIGKDVGEKVRKLIDEHIAAEGIEQRIEPVEITDAKFTDRVRDAAGPRAKASEMEHALRYHIRKHFEEDPERYKSLSERLEGILQEFKNEWDELADALQRLVTEARAGRQEDSTGLDPRTQRPFLAVLLAEVAPDGQVSEEQSHELIQLTVEIVDHVRQEIAIVGFWGKTQAQEQLRSWIFQALDERNLLPLDRLGKVADRMMELAKANHQRLVS